MQSNETNTKKRTYTCSNGVEKMFPKRRTMKIDCPWKVYLACNASTEYFWVMRTKLLDIKEHNHPMTSDNKIYPLFRRMNGADQLNIALKLDARLPPRQILELQRAMENPAVNDRFINDDIYNLQKRFASANAGHHELTEILEFLDDYGYISCYDVDSYSKTMKSLFITHPRSIERARAFPDVIVIDTTYKTNVNRMPLTHIVGIDNLCSKKVPAVCNHSVLLLLLSPTRKQRRIHG